MNDDGERGHQVWQDEQRLYKQHGYQLAWTDGKRGRGQLEGLIRALRAAGEDGLEAADYQLAQYRARGDSNAIHEIAMNMERWCWLPDDLGSRYLLVNIPAFHLDAIENGKRVLAMKVVTGKKDSPIPIYLVYFTAWEENGALQHAPDVYGLDRRDAAANAGQ